MDGSSNFITDDARWYFVKPKDLPSVKPNGGGRLRHPPKTAASKQEGLRWTAATPPRLRDVQPSFGPFQDPLEPTRVKAPIPYEGRPCDHRLLVSYDGGVT